MTARKRKVTPENREWLAGVGLVQRDRLFGKLRLNVLDGRDDTRVPAWQWAAVTRVGEIICATRRRGSREEWAYAIAHCALHLGFGHFERVPEDARAWNYACDAIVANFLASVRFGSAPPEYRVDYPAYGRDERAFYRELKLRGGTPESYAGDLLFGEPRYWWPEDVNFQARFAAALRQAVTEAVRIAGGVDPAQAWRVAGAGSIADQARNWLMTNYPLIGSVIASFKLIEDIDACRALDVQVAAVCAAEQEIYLNPVAGLSLEQMKFVLAHEALHPALRHDQRQEARDPFLWNCACDYALHNWLVEMKLGQMPPGLLYDPELAGQSAEEIYDRITRDLRLQRKLRRAQTLAGVGKPDMVGPRPEGWWLRGQGVDLDEFYRSALAQGLELQLAKHGRGLVPEGLIEEIRAQALPPIPWDVKLAQWLDQFFPIPEYRRSYARPSRRQSATPDIPRPRVVPQEGWEEARTFGVVLDTSGSMSPLALARALGAVASYCVSREVPAVRVVFCDAAAYDAGYLSAEEVAGRVRVRGRGGTVLQPGIDLLERADDFPREGPILVVTDTYCEPQLTLRREHAFLIPHGRRLPFAPRGPVFTMPPDRSEGGY